MSLFIAQDFISPIDANELSEVQSHHTDGPEKLIQKWLCLVRHHGLLSSQSPVLTGFWSRLLQSVLSDWCRTMTPPHGI